MQEMQATWVRSLGREDPLEEGMATQSSILAWLYGIHYMEFYNDYMESVLIVFLSLLKLSSETTRTLRFLLGVFQL